MLPNRHPLVLAISLAALPLAQSHAQNAGTAQLPTTVISASALAQSATQMVSASEVLEGSQLLLQRQAPLGDTVKNIPGVRGSSFGAGASRPGIRGMDGARVRVLSDGVGMLDASTLSADHAVTTEPLLLERIEVLKGPATLLYGGGAIGGVVNLIDKKIPTQQPENGHQVDLEWQGNTVAKESTAIAGATLGLEDFALRVEGLKRDADPYRLAGHEDGSRSKKQTGSYNDTSTGTLGLSWIGDEGYLGVAYTRQANEYGLLAHEEGHCHTHGHGATLHWHCGSHGGGHNHDHDHGAPYIDMVQKRWDVRGEYNNPFAGFSLAKLRLAHTDYQHEEIEGQDVATRFDNKATDARLELTHDPLFGWRGTIGGQSTRRNFKASGEEAYVPATLTNNHAVFVLEEYQWNDLRYELGLRHEWQNIDVRKGTKPNRNHHGTSVSIGAVWDFAADYNLGASFSRSQRLPEAEELYAFGPHAASRTIEQGNTQLDKETSHNIELTLRKHQGALTYSLSLYQNRINDYIYGKDTGKRPGADYRVISYQQDNAVFRGVEGQMAYQFSNGFTSTVLADHVRGKLRGKGGDLARIPADRVGLRLQHTFTSALDGQVELWRVQQQNNIADYETKTSGYNMLGAALNYQGQLSSSDYTLYLRADNLLNVKAREHTSFIKDDVQLPGRNLTAGVKFSF